MKAETGIPASPRVSTTAFIISGDMFFIVSMPLSSPISPFIIADMSGMPARRWGARERAPQKLEPPNAEKKKTMPLIKLLLILWTLLLAGCLVHRLENAARLMEHPEFPAAAKAAPRFTADALKTINSLEEAAEAGE